MLNPNNLFVKPAVGRSEYGRIKVALPRGRGLMDWVKLSAGKVLASKRLPNVSEAELKSHCTVDDCWIVLLGQVYDISTYLEFHPGGIPELMRAAGRDATPLFNQYHAWVNYESMLKSCLVGRFSGDVSKLPPCSPSTIEDDSPGRTTKKSEPIISLNDDKMCLLFDDVDNLYPENVTVEMFNSEVPQFRVLVKPFGVPSTEVLYRAVDESLLNSAISVETKVNRVEISFDGLESRLETLLPSSKRTISKRPAARYRQCRLISHCFVNHDTVVFRVILQEKSNFSIPIGHHVSIKIRKGAATLYRPYTPIGSNYDEETYTTSIDFMIKVYDDGICSPFFRQLKTDDTIEISDPIGEKDIVRSIISPESHIVLLAAGTGLTPMIRIVEYIQIHSRDTRVTLYLFNKTENDVVSDDCLPMKWTDSFPIVKHVLSNPSAEWKGLRGRIDEHMLPTLLKDTKFCLCGPDGFLTSACLILNKMDILSENIILFQG